MSFFTLLINKKIYYFNANYIIKTIYLYLLVTVTVTQLCKDT